MRSARFLLLLFLVFLFAACGGGGGTGDAGGSGATVPPPALGDTPAGANVLPVTVTGTLIQGVGLYLNKPTVSVTVCAPDGTSCQTIGDILLDTGSYGLRLFRSVVTAPLTPVTRGNQTVAECAHFADGSSSWGPVALAGVILGGEPLVQVPIQLVDAAFATPPAACANPQQSPANTGFNGILGVGLFAEDCGAVCATSAVNGIYYGCTSGGACSGITVAAQVRNPVAGLPLDGNGVIVRLPAVPPGGAPSASGSLILGIGTRSNNTPSGVTAYAAGNTGEFITTFGGTTHRGFIDSGSNAFFFPSPGVPLPECTGVNAGWFCPPAPVTLPATNTGSGGSPSGTLSFQVGNFASSIGSGNRVFSDIAGPNAAIGFDWGLTFFFGRDVCVGLEGTSSPVGTGPYWAY